ncbi:MAG: hypothetical protein EPO51_22320 [Phenylobacterium sp.]|uniref:hypothetical protein n=1 Tax=Phenylobacterium sp. TaxID=1871053 RepID=UPI0012172881|nr:hypothetical protein [Phenylobacterium sp.]TAJ69463.1 MAG: hypothetical protein EPO51_22320 [Phenylobacterium sp.]
MKIALFATATAAVALLGGAAYAQDPAPKPPTPGSVTGDWNGAHSPTDDKQYTSKVTVPVGSTPSETVAAPPVDTGVTTTTETTAATDVAAPASTQAATVTTSTVTNGPVPDTAENRAKYGQPMSRAGKRTAAKGN